jgi:cysteine desulfuration protein SufE
VKLGPPEGPPSGPRSVELIAEVAEEAPTVKGFVAVLAEVVRGRPADEVLAIRDDLLDRLGLAEVLGIMRARGLRSIVEHVKRNVVSAIEKADGSR